MTKTNALITLTPLDPYFFGSEATHGDANYFARSNRWPQQSTLCGVMRHLLYTYYGDKGRGLNSFTPNADPPLDDYGHLRGLSALFLRREKEGKIDFFLRQPFNRFTGKDENPWGLTPFEVDDTTLFLTDLPTPAKSDDPLPWRKLPTWQKPEGKKFAADAWVSTTGEVIKSEDIFKEFTRPGITKKPGEKRRNREAGFYKQAAYRLTTGWSFAVLAELDETVDPDKLHGTCLPLGGEKTIFHLDVKREARQFEAIFEKEKLFSNGVTLPPGYSLLALTSDAFLEEEDFTYAVAGVTETTDFRHLNTRAEAKDPEHFGPMHRRQPGEEDFGKSHLAKSGKYTLLERGSVLVCETANLKTLTDALDRQPWHDIGFNHYFTYTSAKS